MSGLIFLDLQFLRTINTLIVYAFLLDYVRKLRCLRVYYKIVLQDGELHFGGRACLANL